MTTPIAPIARSPAMNFKIEIDDSGTEWCINTSNNKAPEREYDWEAEWDKAIARDEEKRVAEANFKFHQDIRAKMFKNVLGGK